ncbi:thioredoxin-like protein [Xylariales sp. PMI_506]|nr:thioredoxin-like protein [Xylariales sp. PMI_506]
MYMSEPPPLGTSITFEIFYGVSSPWALLGAPLAEKIAKENNLTIHLRPTTVIQENGGIMLRTRHPARQAYHALDLFRWAKLLNVPMKAKPKFYPPKPGCIELAGQAIIRVQRHYGIGSEEALKYSFAVQNCIWVTEDGDYCEVETLQKIAREIGLPEDVIEKCVVDRRSDPEDEGVNEWVGNHNEAAEKGMFGTPNYVINGEIFWGQDRLPMVEARIKELVAAGAVPVTYS